MEEFIKLFFNFFYQGGFVVVTLFGVASLLFFLLAGKFLYLFESANNDLVNYKSIKVSHANKKISSLIRKSHFHDFKYKVDKHMSLIQVLIIVCPVLGLLGTVTGMIEVFDVVAVMGTGNARALAAGITKATLPTMVGMTISIMGLLLLSVIKNKITVLTTKS